MNMTLTMTMTMTITKAKYFSYLKGKKLNPVHLYFTQLSPSSQNNTKKNKILANKKFNNHIKNINDIRNYYETETNNYKKKLIKYKKYNNKAELTELLLSSIATTETTSSVALTGIGLPYSMPTAFATATVRVSLSKTFNTKVRNKVIKYSQM